MVDANINFQKCIDWIQMLQNATNADISCISMTNPRFQDSKCKKH